MSEAVPERPRVLALVGPTAVGKSAVAQALAEMLHGEIVSADSMQVYRGMDIGTSKQPVAQRTVPYHCLDLVDPGTPFSAALYQSAAREAIAAIAARSAVPVVTGGTGLYLRAALDAMEFPAGEAASAQRASIEARLETLGPEGLHAVLAERDPASAALIHPNNTRRVVRALEMLEVDGVSYANQQAHLSQRRSRYPTTWIGLTMDRATLYRRIDARVDAMVRDGLLEEVERLLAAGYRDALTASQAIGYKELLGVVDGTASLEEALDRVKRSTRRYAKRQLTWFRADPRIRWIDVTHLSCGEAAARASALVESSSEA